MRLHLAQVFYSPAYFDAPLDYLAEPTDGKLLLPEIGRLRDWAEVNGLLVELKGSTTAHLINKLHAIALWSAGRKADVLVFPEYSVPVQALQRLQDVAKQHKLTIIAGSHRVPAGDESRSIYQDLGIPSLACVGTAICPILLPSGAVTVVAKSSRSKWEPSLQVGVPAQVAIDVPSGGGTTRVGVLLCIDALSPQSLGLSWADPERRPALVICPSLSPSTTPFTSVAELVSLNDAAFAYANSAAFGGTVFYVPDQWKSAVEMSTGSFAPLPADVEGIVEADFQPDQLFLKRGSALAEVLARRPLNIPIVYHGTHQLLSQLQVLAGFIKEALDSGDVATAIDCLDTYLTEPEKGLHELTLKNLQNLRHSVLPLYSGDLRLIDEAFQFLELPEGCAPTRQLWANQTRKAIDTLVALMGREDITDPPDSLWNSVKVLKRLQRVLPVPDTGSEEQTVVFAAPEPGFKGNTNLIEAFQNRGNDFDRLRDFTQNADARVLFVVGGRGIGKTDFLNAVFLKNLHDWQVIRIPLAQGSRVARVITDIAFQVGISFDIDSLAAATYHVFQQKVRKVFSAFYTRQKRALILDDIADLLEDATARDFRHFETLLQEARSPQRFGGGRVILVSSAWIKSQWINAKGVSQLPLREIQDKYVRRVIEYQLRLKGAVRGEAPPSIPQQLLDLVRGHPLSARLLVDAMGDKGLPGLADDLEGVTEHIARELLKHVNLDEDQTGALTAISVYRLPVRADLLSYEDLGVRREELADLARGAVIDYDGAMFSMHEAVRRYFYTKMQVEARQRQHLLAVSYYERERNELEKRGVRNPGTAAELVYHAVMCGDATVAGRLKTLVVEELKPAARRIYREERDYERALRLYRVIGDIVPYDAEVAAYLGRCYARLRSWDESDVCFRRAVQIAGTRGEQWWVLRDWGHIRARYGFYDEARECFERAEEKRGRKEASISAALAYMYWHQGDIETARGLFEEALELNPNHQYTLAYYAKLLDQVGEYSLARGTRERLDALEGLASQPDNDIEVETDDL
jgi:tetratricopeptide (TPR) repeat protein/predicted amidohydrolase